MRHTIWLAILVAALLGLASPSYAQATRTWVSGVGDDANPCSRTAPCKTFAGAISKTSAGGEINTIDTGGFGAVTITKAITIRSDSIEAGVLVAGTNGIVVAAGAADKVVLEGLDFEGLGSTANSLNGVKVVSGAAVYIVRCAIRDFVNINGTDGNGVLINSSTAGTRVLIKDSFIENNTGGVNVNGSGGTANSVAISNTTIDGNVNFALQVGATGNSAALVRSLLTGSPTGISFNGSGGTVNSIGPSNVITGAGAPTIMTNYR